MILFTNKSEKYQNAVDFLLAKFPPEMSSNSNQETGMIENVDAPPKVDEPIQVKTETEDIATHNTNVSNEANGADDKELQFDPSLGAAYGFTELNVSFQPKNR